MTLVEGVIASLVLSLVVVIAWRLFMTGAKSAELAAWHTKCQQQLRNGLKLLRDDIAHASYPSEVGPTAVNVTRPGFGFKFHPGQVTLSDGAASTALAEFWICRPTKTGFGAAEDDPGERIHATLATDGNTVRYKKEGAVNPAHNCDRVLFDEVDYVKLEGPASAPAEKASTCAIEVKTVHKIWKQSGVIERTVAKVEVDVSAGL